jgi:RNA polymerase primary sigma factor
LVGFSKEEQLYLNELSKLYPKKNLSNDAIISKIKEYRESNDQKILDELIFNFVKLLIKAARKYNRADIDIGDLIHYGIDGLIDAISNSFNINSRTKFITYATLVVERRMKDGLDINRSTVRLPRHKIIKKRKEKYLGITTSDNTLKTKITVSNFVDFSAILGRDSDSEFEKSVDKKLEYESLVYDLNRIFNKILTKIEIDIVTMYFGLNDNPKIAIDIISRNLIMTTLEVRELLETSLQKIRNNTKAMGILNKYLN